MNYQKKIELAKVKMDKLGKPKQVKGLQVFANEEMEQLSKQFADMQVIIADALTITKNTSIDAKGANERELNTLNEKISQLNDLVESGLIVKNLKDIEKITSVTVDNLKDFKLPEIKIPAAKVITNDIYDEYKAADSEYGGNTTYHGFVNRAGKWFVLRQNGEESVTYRYASGDGKYTQGWRNRNMLDYVLYSELVL